jgi:membrane-associated phospholipid phosphatase
MMHRPRVRRHGGDAACAVAAGLAFGVLAGAVTLRMTQPIDDDIDRRHPHPRRGLLRGLATGVKEGGRPPMQLALAALITVGLRRGRVAGADAVVIAGLAALLADQGCKQLIHRRRPPRYHGDEEHLSFPSGHTTAAAALAVTAAALLERQGIVRSTHARLAAATCIAVVAETRLLLGEHWASDVAGGALLGSAVACGVLATVALTQPARGITSLVPALG